MIAYTRARHLGKLPAPYRVAIMDMQEVLWSSFDDLSLFCYMV